MSSLLERDAVRALLAVAPRSVVVDAARNVVDEARRDPTRAPTDAGAWAAAVERAVAAASRPSLRRVLNATGVVLHTNLGRAPLAQAAIDAIARAAAGFSNLEFDLDTGARGSRYTHCASLLRELTGAEDALVVNNCAAALVLALDTLARGRDAIVSRGELIEIGGSFRIPDIMARSGARLVEVGTTNRTHADDYRRAISAETGAIVKVHRSNFALEGYVAEASGADLAALAAERTLPLIHDLGSGLLFPLTEFGLVGEPTAPDAIRDGAAIVTMSGDKLLGGPQAGLMFGSRALLERVRRNPLTRAFRVDKLTLAALEATLALYRDRARALREIPALAQLTASYESVRARAEAIAAALCSTRTTVRASDASVGGGAFPTAKIPSAAVVLDGPANELEQRLRACATPVIARIDDGRVWIDLRTIFPADEPELIASIREAMA